MFSHRFHFLMRYSPTDFTEHTEVFAEIFSHRFHRFTQIFIAKGSVYSVKSVGVFIAIDFCEFCGFCGSFYSYKIL